MDAGHYKGIEIKQAVGGGWTAGLGLRALMTMGLRHAAYEAPLPRVAARGG